MTIFHVLKYAVANDGIRREDFNNMPLELRDKMREAVDNAGAKTKAEACAIALKVVMEWDGEE